MQDVATLNERIDVFGCKHRSVGSGSPGLAGLPSNTTSLLSKGVGVTPLMVTPGTKNLVTDNMKPISATTVGR